MNSLNSVLVEGNLTADPVSRTAGTSNVVSFTVAVNRSFKQGNEYKEEVSYIDIEAWGRTAEQCSANLSKGRGVRVIGRLKQDRWQDADGTKRAKVKIIGESVEFKPKFDRKPGDDSGPTTGEEIPF